MVRTTKNASAKRVYALAGTLLVLAGTIGPVMVRAGVVTVPNSQAFIAGGQALEIQPPPSVEPGKLVSTTSVKVFREHEKFYLPDAVLVDAVDGGRVDRAKDLSYGKIYAGIRANVYFVHADAGDTPNAAPLTGTMEFNEPILGVLISEAALSRSDAMLGAPETIYPMTEVRGLDLDQGDWFEVSRDRKSIRFNFNPVGGIDQMRVITLAEEDDAPNGMTSGGSITFGGGGMGDGTAGGPGRPAAGGDVPLMDDGGGGSGSSRGLDNLVTNGSGASVPETPKDMVPPTIPTPKDSVPDNPNIPPVDPPPSNPPPEDPPHTPAPGGLLLMGVGAIGGMRRRRG